MSGNQDFATKEDLQNIKNDIISQFRMISEDVLSHVRVVADGVLTVDEKVDRNLSTINGSIAENSKEILAAVKFSYAELDRRLTSLEHEFIKIKLRVENVEKRNIS